MNNGGGCRVWKKGCDLQRAQGSGPHAQLSGFREGRVDVCRLPLLIILLLISLTMTSNPVQTLSLLQMPDQTGKPCWWLALVSSTAQLQQARHMHIVS